MARREQERRASRMKTACLHIWQYKYCKLGPRMYAQLVLRINTLYNSEETFRNAEPNPLLGSCLQLHPSNPSVHLLGRTISVEALQCSLRYRAQQQLLSFEQQLVGRANSPCRIAGMDQSIPQEIRRIVFDALPSYVELRVLAASVGGGRPADWPGAVLAHSRRVRETLVSQKADHEAETADATADSVAVLVQHAVWHLLEALFVSLPGSATGAPQLRGLILPAFSHSSPFYLRCMAA